MSFPTKSNTKDRYHSLPVIITILFLSCSNIAAQTPEYNYFYRIYFKDKGLYSPSDYLLSDLLTPKAVERRAKHGIENPDLNDIPVFGEYINLISDKGFILHSVSKWMNTALFKSVFYIDLTDISNYSFVSEIKLVKTPAKASLTTDKLAIEYSNLAPSPYDRPIEMLNGYSLHNSGYDGNGITIAVLDGGFYKSDLIPSLSDLRRRNGLAGSYDFIQKDENVFKYSDHGTAVLSVLSGKIPNLLQGTAPGADYWLFRTEDVSSEYPVEEDFWIAAAEYADSIGADIITSSLGYYKFDDPSLDYKFQDLDGNSAFTTKAADIAASKGILVIVSAGNERTNAWKRIIAPSDGDSVLAVGAVDQDRAISVFSSAGPSYDGRIKPDIVAMGVDVPVQTNETTVRRANGTSFSCPVLSGLCACVIQAIPKATNYQIIEALHTNSHKFNLPDSLYGFGIPDMVATLTWLQDKLIDKPDSEISLSPNPFIEDIEINFSDPPGNLTIEIINMSGTLMDRKIYTDFAGRSLIVSELQKYSQGIYFLRIITDHGTFIKKIIKLKN